MHVRLATHRLPRVITTDHEFRVPLDHDEPDGRTITVFAREVVAPARARDDLPWLVFFQGGPGMPSFRPTGRDHWLGRALRDHRVLLLDQRGTGRSSPVNRQTLGLVGPPDSQAEQLALHRADSIVRDAERIRRELVGEGTTWSVVGESYGGFCVTAYLSLAPAGLREAFVIGGLPPLSATASDVYRAMYPRVLDRNRQHFERYPGDGDVAARVMAALRASPVQLPGGDPLTPRRFQSLGMGLGMSDGSERLHHLLEQPFIDGAGGPALSDAFLMGVEAATSFVASPLYVVLHESIYCQGAGAAGWAAERVRREFPAFDPDGGGPVRFTGEMIYPSMFEDHAALRPFREVAERLARRDQWPPLYDIERLRANDIPCAAVVYHNDMYVDVDLSLAAAREIRGLRTWVTNEYEHDGSRRDGENVLGHLIDLVRGER